MSECEGCTDNGICELQQWGWTAVNECPCTQCIIKVICKIGCDKLDNYYQNTKTQKHM